MNFVRMWEMIRPTVALGCDRVEGDGVKAPNMWVGIARKHTVGDSEEGLAVGQGEMVRVSNWWGQFGV